MSLEHARNRYAFGGPIGRFQGLAFQLSDLAVKVENAHNLTYKAAWLKDAGRPYSDMHDFLTRVEADEEDVRSLIHAGACDALRPGGWRLQMRLEPLDQRIFSPLVLRISEVAPDTTAEAWGTIALTTPDECTVSKRLNWQTDVRWGGPLQPVGPMPRPWSPGPSTCVMGTPAFLRNSTPA